MHKTRTLLILFLLAILTACSKTYTPVPEGSEGYCGIAGDVTSVNQRCYPLIQINEQLHQGGMILRDYEAFIFDEAGKPICHNYAQDTIINRYPYYHRYILKHEGCGPTEFVLGKHNRHKTDLHGRIYRLRNYENDTLYEECRIYIDNDTNALRIRYIRKNYRHQRQVKKDYIILQPAWWYIKSDEDLVTNAHLVRLDSIVKEGGKDRVDHYTYKYCYDQKGNWVSRITYRNGKPIYLTTRDITYRDGTPSDFQQADEGFPTITTHPDDYGWPIVIRYDFAINDASPYRNRPLSQLVQDELGQENPRVEKHLAKLRMINEQYYLSQKTPQQEENLDDCYIVSEYSDTAKAYYMEDRRHFILRNREYFERAHFGETRAEEYIQRHYGTQCKQ